MPPTYLFPELTRADVGISSMVEFRGDVICGDNEVEDGDFSW